MKNKIYQTGTISSLLSCVYDGDVTVNELMKYGEIGLGTFDGVDGELIACDGVCYRANANCELSVADAKQNVPFAVVAPFVPDIEFAFDRIVDLATLEELILQALPSLNYIYSIRVDGEFNCLVIRSEKCQPKPYRALSETLPQVQNVFTYSNIMGTLVGVWYPSHLSQVNVAGFHFHFIDKNLSCGGHVFSFSLNPTQVKICRYSKLEVELIDNQMFADATMKADIEASVNSVERLTK